MNTELKKLNKIKSSCKNYSYDVSFGNKVDYNSHNVLTFTKTVKNEYIIIVWENQKVVKKFEFIEYLKAKKQLKFIFKQYNQFANSLDNSFKILN